MRGFAWFFAWPVGVLMMCGTFATLPGLLHDFEKHPHSDGFGAVLFFLSLALLSLLLRFVALPRAIRAGKLAPNSMREFVQLAFCWFLAWLSMYGGVFAARAIGDFTPVFLFGALALALMLIEVPPRVQPSRA